MTYFITGCLHLDYPVSCLVQLCVLPTLRYQRTNLVLPCGTLCHLAVPCATLRYLAVFSMTRSLPKHKFLFLPINYTNTLFTLYKLVSPHHCVLYLHRTLSKVREFSNYSIEPENSASGEKWQGTLFPDLITGTDPFPVGFCNIYIKYPIIL